MTCSMCERYVDLDLEEINQCTRDGCMTFSYCDDCYEEHVEKEHE